MSRFVVIADDLTGAADTGVQFCHVSTPVLLCSTDQLPRPGRESIPGVLAVHTGSRHLPAREAAQRVRRAGLAVKPLEPQLVYKKIDSCMRGNIGAEVDSLMEALGRQCTFIAPAFPDQGRTTIHDVHFVRGVPLAESEMGRDPVSPVGTSRLSELVAHQSRFSVGRVDLDDLEASSRRLEETVNKLLNEGRRLIVFDAVNRNHLESIARLAWDRFPGSLPAGSAGLAAALIQCLRGKTVTPPLSEIVAGPRLLFVCGSGSPVLATQVETLVRVARIGRHLLEPHLSSARQSLLDAVDRDLAAGGAVLQLAPPGVGDPHAATVSPEQAARQLATAAATIIDRQRPDGLFLCGGDTALAVLDALGANGLWLEFEVLPGLVRGRVKGGNSDGLLVVTKAGGFGDSDSLLRLYSILTGKVFLHE